MIDYASVPVDYMAGAVQRYIEQGYEPGSFMQAMLSNDLYTAVARADSANSECIIPWIIWISNNLPTDSYGSHEKYSTWIAKFDTTNSLD